MPGLSSTAAVYGTPEERPITESTAPAPINPYGQTKLATENASRTAGQHHGLRYAILRSFNAATADQTARPGSGTTRRRI